MNESSFGSMKLRYQVTCESPFSTVCTVSRLYAWCIIRIIQKPSQIWLGLGFSCGGLWWITAEKLENSRYSSIIIFTVDFNHSDTNAWNNRTNTRSGISHIKAREETVLISYHAKHKPESKTDVQHMLLDIRNLLCVYMCTAKCIDIYSCLSHLQIVTCTLRST